MDKRKTIKATINTTPHPQKIVPENNQAKKPKMAEKTITTKEMKITAPFAHPRFVSLSKE